jgi:dihydroxy-acid dehydratase
MHIGGTPAVIEVCCLKKDFSMAACMTVTGKTIAENLKRSLPGSESRAADRAVPLKKPIKSSGHIRIMRGNVAPEGAVAKITGKEGLVFTGTARVL